MGEKVSHRGSNGPSNMLLRHHALILDRLLTFLTTLVLKPSSSQSLSLHSHLSYAQANLLEFDQLVSLAVVVFVSGVYF